MSTDDFSPIPNNPGYSVNRLGVVMGRTNKELRHQEIGGFKCVSLLTRVEGLTRQTHKTHYVHRLVAELFVTKPEGWHTGWYVSFRDANKANFQASNLVWLTPEEGEEQLRRGPKRESEIKKARSEAVRFLRAYGLPDEMALPEWEEIEARNKERHAELLARLREAEASGLLNGIDVPWAAQREAFEKDQAQGIEYPFIATMSSYQPFNTALRQSLNRWKRMRISREATEAKRDAKKP